MGAGGAGTAVAHASLELGTRVLHVVDDDRARAEELVTALGSAARAAGPEDLPRLLAGADGLVHATPTGMASHPGVAIDPELLHPGLWVAEVVYRPLVTPLLERARERGCRTLDGGAWRSSRPPTRSSCSPGSAPIPTGCSRTSRSWPRRRARGQGHSDRLPERHARGEAHRGRRRGLRRRRALRAGSHRLPVVTLRGPRAGGRAGPADRAVPAVPGLRGRARRAAAAQPAARRGEVRRHGGPRRGHDARAFDRASRVRRRRRPRGRAAARAGRARRRAWPARRVRGARLGPPRERVRPRVADRRRGRPSGARRLPGLLPRPLARHRPRGHPRDPRRQAVLPAARRCAAPAHGRPAVEPPPTAASRVRARSISTGFCRHVLAAGYDGPLSLEVFNDVFRQADPGRTAVDAMRSLLVLEDELGLGSLPAAPALRGYAFAELAVGPGSAEDAERILDALGFRHVGPHRSKPVQRWDSGAARVLLNHGDAHGDGVAALAVESADAHDSVRRAEALLAPGPRAAAQRRRGRPRGGRRPRRDVGVLRRRRRGVALGLRRARRRRAAGDRRCSRSTTSPCRSRSTPSTRRCSSTGRCSAWSRGPARISPRPTASCAAGRSATTRSAWRSTSPCSARRTSRRRSTSRSCATTSSPSPGRCASTAPTRCRSRTTTTTTSTRGSTSIPGSSRSSASCDVLVDRDARGGTFLHCYTPAVGRVFFEVVERRGGYDGYGAADAPVRMAAQRRAASPQLHRA